MKGFKFDRMPEAHKDGGYTCSLSEEALKRQKGVIWDIIKQLGGSITGFGKKNKDLIGVSLPVRIFEPRSYLERLVDGWWSAPIFLPLAAKATDPVERLKYVMTFCVAAFHATCDQEGKPFNPILGETYEAKYEDGTQIYCEQSSHHPPVTNWQFMGADNLYHFYGYGEWTASIRANSVTGHQKGPHYVEFQDGTVITFNLPIAYVKGVLYGDRIIEYEGVMNFVDKKNNLTCDLTFNPKPEGGSSWNPFKGKEHPSDYLKGDIIRTKGSKQEVVSKVEGTWMGCVEFDGKKYWDFTEQYEPYKPIRPDDPLPSDCRYRQDLDELLKGNIDSAQEWKVKLENKQRKEKALRAEGEQMRAELKAMDEKPNIVKRPPKKEASSSGSPKEKSPKEKHAKKSKRNSKHKD
eukprot:TRINITY_DN3463_c0_g1_i1.p1 TRINITY_DN3463_c0_g1~~TRINITY_DN3463_c0_g1_i1.p1  ORF type:complete len:406 (-),score=109.39 TRINITY_DN3463_c0_g1_i1:15-1232(-)